MSEKHLYHTKLQIMDLKHISVKSLYLKMKQNDFTNKKIKDCTKYSISFLALPHKSFVTKGIQNMLVLRKKKNFMENK